MPVPFVNKNENTYKSQKELTNNHFHINVNESPIVEPINQTNRGKNVRIVCLSVSNRKQNVFTNLDILNWIFFLLRAIQQQTAVNGFWVSTLWIRFSVNSILIQIVISLTNKNKKNENNRNHFIQKRNKRHRVNAPMKSTKFA